MKKTMAALCACLCAVAAADEEVMVNGDCEMIAVHVKGTSKNLMGHIRKGWTFDIGPIAFFPKGWWPNGDAGEFRAIDASEDDALKPFVHGGRAAMYLAPKGKTTGVYNQLVSPQAGTYEVSFWSKGTGSARIVFANYDNERFLRSENPGIFSKPSDDWAETRVTVEIGKVPGSVRMSPILIVSGGGVYLDDFSMIRKPTAEPQGCVSEK